VTVDFPVSTANPQVVLQTVRSSTKNWQDTGLRLGALEMVGFRYA
jgi:hypothetical protein